jgi:DNA transformation protein
LTASTPKDAFAAHCAELLSGAGPVRVKRMFGGHGLYVDDLFVALIASDVLYLKVDDANRAAFQAAGSQPFVYTAGQRPMTMSYWSAPDEAMDSPALMLPWVRLALQAALTAANRKLAPKPRTARQRARR